jgi:hypothetical protein
MTGTDTTSAGYGRVAVDVDDLDVTLARLREARNRARTRAPPGGRLSFAMAGICTFRAERVGLLSPLELGVA